MIQYSNPLLPFCQSPWLSDLLKHASLTDGASCGDDTQLDASSKIRPAAFRTCIKLMDQSFRSSMQGPGLEITAEVGGDFCVIFVMQDCKARHRGAHVLPHC